MSPPVMTSPADIDPAEIFDLDIFAFGDFERSQLPTDTTAWQVDQFGEQHQATMTWRQDDGYMSLPQEHEGLQPDPVAYPNLNQHDVQATAQHEEALPSAYEHIYDDIPETQATDGYNPGSEPAIHSGYWQFGELILPADSWPAVDGAPYYHQQPDRSAPPHHPLASASITVDFDHDPQAMPHANQAMVQPDHLTIASQTPVATALQPASRYPPEVLVLVEYIHNLRRTPRNLPYRSDLKDGSVPMIRQHFCSRRGILKRSSILRDYYGDENLFDMTFWEFLDNVRER